MNVMAEETTTKNFYSLKNAVIKHGKFYLGGGGDTELVLGHRVIIYYQVSTRNILYFRFKKSKEYDSDYKKYYPDYKVAIQNNRVVFLDTNKKELQVRQKEFKNIVKAIKNFPSKDSITYYAYIPHEDYESPIKEVAKRWYKEKGFKYEIFYPTDNVEFEKLNFAVDNYYAIPYYEEKFGKEWLDTFYNEVNTMFDTSVNKKLKKSLL